MAQALTATQDARKAIAEPPTRSMTAASMTTRVAAVVHSSHACGVATPGTRQRARGLGQDDAFSQKAPVPDHPNLASSRTATLRA
jgi:hypothetical protein